MIETPQQILESSFEIAWNYPVATGELGEPDIAERFLRGGIEVMMLRGEGRTLYLANRVIAEYRGRRARRGLAKAS